MIFELSCIIICLLVTVSYTIIGVKYFPSAQHLNFKILLAINLTLQPLLALLIDIRYSHQYEQLQSLYNWIISN